MRGRSYAAYDVVVLHEDIPATTVADFREYAGKFAAEARKNHSRGVVDGLGLPTPRLDFDGRWLLKSASFR